MAAPGVSLIQSFPYRDKTDEEWSNQYHFSGSHPTDDAGWRALVDQLASVVRVCLPSDVSIVRAYCYENLDGAHDSVFTYDMVDEGTSVVGALSPTLGQQAPGDAAMWCRWKTARTNSRGKPIYLRKYYHGVMVGGSDEPGRDEVNHTQRDALQLTAEYLLAGSDAWPPLAGPDGVIPGSIATSRFITTRTLKRRGKRPH